MEAEGKPSIKAFSGAILSNRYITPLWEIKATKSLFSANNSVTSTPRAAAIFSNVDNVGLPLIVLLKLSCLIFILWASSVMLIPLVLHTSFIRSCIIYDIKSYSAKVMKIT